MSEDSSVLSRSVPSPDAEVVYGPGPEQVADVRFGGPKAEGRPLVILIHGGFWRPAYDRIHTGPMSRALAAAGWTVAAPEYRRLPGNPDATLEDVRLALETLPSKVGHHNGKVLLIGHSAGGHLVLWAAAAKISPAIVGVVALAPVADLELAHQRHLGGGAVEAFLGAAPGQRFAAIDPKKMSTPPVPVTIIQGDEDEVVPPAIANSYLAAHPGVRLVPVKAAGHFALIDPETPAWPTVIAELERLAGGGV